MMDIRDGFSILTLDGGGVRGIYGAQLLARIEASLDANIRDHFDLIAGTSTDPSWPAPQQVLQKDPR